MSPIARRLAPATLLLALPLATPAQGLNLPAPLLEQWSARLSVTVDAVQRRPAISLLGDHFFGTGMRPNMGSPLSGFRASSGLILGAGSASLGAAGALDGTQPPDMAARPGSLASSSGLFPDSPLPRWTTQPYAGLGYSHRGADGVWGLSADLGIVAESASDWSLGRALLGPNRLDEAIRALRLRPVLQLGVRYRF